MPENDQMCAVCKQELAMCSCPHPLLLQVADALAAKGYNAAYEYPGFVSLTFSDGRIVAFGDVNVDYGASWQESDESINFFMPETATVDELVAAIEGWITEQLLSPVAADILRKVLAAMEHADGMYGPEDYIPLMQAIAFEANQRIMNARANHGGVK